MGPRPGGHEPLAKRLEYALKRALLQALSVKTRGGEPGPPRLGPQSRVLAFRLNNLGDALVVTPLLHALKSQTGCTVEVVCGPRNRVIFDGHPAVDEVYVLGKGPRGLWAHRRRVHRRRYDAVIDLHDDVSTTVAYAVALTPAPVKVAIDHELTGIYTAVAPKGDAAREHVLRRLARIAPLLGLELDPATANVVFPLPEAAVSHARDWVARQVAPGFRVGVNLSAGTQARYWPAEHWAEVIGHVRARGASVVLIAAPADEPLARRVSELSGGLPAYLERDYRRFAAIVPLLDLLLTPDTAIVHLASAARVPVFGLYVQVRPEVCIWYPYQSRYATYQTAHTDLSQTTPAEVLPVLAPFLESLQQNRSTV